MMQAVVHTQQHVQERLGCSGCGNNQSWDGDPRSVVSAPAILVGQTKLRRENSSINNASCFHLTGQLNLFEKDYFFLKENPKTPLLYFFLAFLAFSDYIFLYVCGFVVI